MPLPIPILGRLSTCVTILIFSRLWMRQVKMSRPISLQKRSPNRYINYFKSTWEQDDDPQGNEPSAEEKPPEPTKPVEGADGPYKSLGKELASSTRGPTIRHYASGKDDDKTIEKNVKDIKAKNYQFLVDVKVTTIEHNDTVSLKYRWHSYEKRLV